MEVNLGLFYLSLALGSNNAGITNSNFVNNKATYNQGSASYGHGGRNLWHF